MNNGYLLKEVLGGNTGKGIGDIVSDAKNAMKTNKTKNNSHMRKVILFALLFLALGQVLGYGQNQLKSKILGKWEGTRQETIRGRKTLNNGQLMREHAVYEFEKNGQVIQHLMSPTFRVPYLIEGDELAIGTLKYVVEKLTDKEMVLLDIKDGSRKDPLAFRHYFKRLK